MDPEELAAARLDDEIAAALRGKAGRATDPTVLWLANTLRADPPARLHRQVAQRITAHEQRRWRVARVAAALLAVVLLAQGIGNFYVGEWISRNIGEPYSRHAMFEMGLALVAAGGAVAAGALRREWLPVAVVAGVPLGVLLGVHGAPEATTFAWGAVLHISEGVCAVALAVAWWRASRYSARSRRQERV